MYYTKVTSEAEVQGRGQSSEVEPSINLDLKTTRYFPLLAQAGHMREVVLTSSTSMSVGMSWRF